MAEQTVVTGCANVSAMEEFEWIELNAGPNYTRIEFWEQNSDDGWYNLDVLSMLGSCFQWYDDWHERLSDFWNRECNESLHTLHRAIAVRGESSL
eukprot:SAG11_NODE_3923_length_2147_cov_0.846680_2_plen_95_part_00